MPSSSPFLTVGMTSVTIATVGRMFTASPAPIDQVSNPGSSGTRSESAPGFVIRRRLLIEYVGTTYNCACLVMLRETTASKFVV